MEMTDPFTGKTVEISDRLVDRLRGQYACGPHLPNGNPEFGWRQFQAPPIQHEAAKRIEELEADLSNTLRAVLHYYGPRGAKIVTDLALELRNPLTVIEDVGKGIAFESKLRRWRKANGLTLEEFAEKTGMTLYALQRIETGATSRLDLRDVRTIIEATGNQLEPFDLIFDENSFQGGEA